MKSLINIVATKIVTEIIVSFIFVVFNVSAKTVIVACALKNILVIQFVVCQVANCTNVTLTVVGVIIVNVQNVVLELK